MPYKNSTILAVDDTPEMLAALVAILSTDGYTVVSADSGEKAIASVKEYRPDLILLDIQMAGMGGLEACRKLKEDPASENVPVILMSAFDDTATWVDGLHLGAVDYITKPFHKSEILSRVATHLSLCQMRQSLEKQTSRLHEVEEMAAEAESKYRELFENSPVGKSMTLPDGTIVPNKALCEMLGYSIAELQALKWQDITPGEDIPGTLEQLHKLKTGLLEKAYFEKRYICKDGSIIWGEVLSYLHLDTMDEPAYFITSIVNVTERRNALLAKEERTRFAEKLIEATALSTWISDEHGTAIRANQACYTLFGASEEEVIGKYNVFKDELVEQQGAMPKVRHAYATGEPVTFFLDYDFGTVKHVDVKMATHRYLQVNLTPIKGADGKITNVVSQSIDITEIKRAEAALRENELKYRIVADNTHDLEIWRDPQGSYVYVSPSCKRITGYDVEEFKKNPGLLETIIDPQDRHLFERHKQNEVASHTLGKVEFRIKRVDGEIRWIEHICLPVFDDEGRYLGIRGSNRDITERKQLEVEQEQLRSQLHQAQKLDAIGQLAGGVAHDFNNILGGISGYVDLLKLKLSGDDETTEYLGKMGSAVCKASYLTRQLLTFARKSKGEKTFFDVRAAIVAVVGLLERTIDSTISIEKNISDAMPFLFADQNLFENCLLNLCLNARDAMPGGGRLIITADGAELPESPGESGRSNRKPGRYIVISIADTGTGMDDATKKHLFEPFFTTKAEGKGTGLGLASVYGFVKQSGGYIEAASEMGNGTAFTMYFPVTAGDPAPQRPPEKVAGNHPAKGTGNILVVEDDADLGVLLQNNLTTSGYRSVLCKDGFEAVKYYREHFKELDAVVLDIILPTMNGFECLHDMKLVNPEVRVIVCTGYVGSASRGILINEGVVAYLEKPIVFTELARYLQQATNHPSGESVEV